MECFWWKVIYLRVADLCREHTHLPEKQHRQHTVQSALISILISKLNTEKLVDEFNTSVFSLTQLEPDVVLFEFQIYHLIPTF
jgi:hypothetical protein